MEIYTVATIIFLLLLIGRIFSSCCIAYYNQTGGCSKKSVSDDEVSSPRASIFVIEVEPQRFNDDLDLPSYEYLMEEAAPPAYDEAIKLPPVFTVISKEDN